jgi:hypothetical protein
VLNRINWCTSHLLTRWVFFLGHHPGWLGLASNRVRTERTNAEAGVVGVDGGVRHIEEVRRARKLWHPIGLGKNDSESRCLINQRTRFIPSSLIVQSESRPSITPTRQQHYGHDSAPSHFISAPINAQRPHVMSLLFIFLLGSKLWSAY